MKGEPSEYYIRREQIESFTLSWLKIPSPVHEVVIPGYERSIFVAHRPYKGTGRWFATGWQITEARSGTIALRKKFPSIQAGIDSIRAWFVEHGMTDESVHEAVLFQIKLRGLSPRFAPVEVS